MRRIGKAKSINIFHHDQVLTQQLLRLESILVGIDITTTAFRILRGRHILPIVQALVQLFCNEFQNA